MNLLVTGGAGFIGSHLVERLVTGNSVTVVDNFYRGSRDNISGVTSRIKLFEGDITDYALMEKLVRGMDAVYHFASVPQVMVSVENPQECINSNILATYNIARLCLENECKLIFASSREVYGDCRDLPVAENRPHNPKNIYGVSKSIGEGAIRMFAESGLEYVIYRISNVTGPRDFGRVLPIFAQKAISDEPLTIYGGRQIIDFISVYDVVDAIEKTSSLKNATLNIGSGKGTPIKELARMVREFSASSSQISVVSGREQEVERFTADISGIRQSGWEPKISLGQQISDVISYVRHSI